MKPTTAREKGPFTRPGESYYGLTSRKKTHPLVIVAGRLVVLIAADPTTFTQFVPKPVASWFVCACKIQPVWSGGQLKCNCDPLKDDVKFGELVAT